MKLVIEATDMMTTVDGVAARVWNGVTERGVRCKLFVSRIAVHTDEDQSQFEADLREMPAPGRVRHAAYPLTC